MATRTADKAAKAAEPKDEEILKEIRERFQYATDQWKAARDEGKTDMCFVAGDTWSAKDRAAREAANRPCLSFDELSQYVNQTINDIRQNKRAVKVTAQGNGATDQTAELRQSLIRQIEYRSNAQQAYTSMFEDAVQRGYGFLRIKAQYVNSRSFDQELLIEALPNPNLVTPDPDGIKPDLGDIQYCFIHERRKVSQFKRDFPHATIQSFTAEHTKEAPQWISADGEHVTIAEYWTIDHRRQQLFMLEPAALALLSDEARKQPKYQQLMTQPARFTAFKDEFQVMPGAKMIVQERWVDVPYVCQYLTNGVELLAKEGASKKTEWPGTSIPVVSCFGKILYIDDDKGTERLLMSQIRLARDPAMLHSYYRTCEAELVGQTPKTPFIGYEGQFRGHEDKWAKVASEPLAYLEAAATTERTGQQVLPLPMRQPYDPPIQSLEVGAESARRGVQAAIGSSPLPTQAQRRNEKSGVALQRMEDSAQKGSFHFVDHYDYALTRVGAILDELVPHYYDTARDVTVRQPDDTPKVVRINDPSKPDQKYGEANTTTGDHDVTISVGPAYASEREAASDFADQLAGNPQIFPIIGDLVVKLKNLGPVGDQIADRLKAMLPPPVKALVDAEAQGDESPEVAQVKAQAQAMIEQLQQQLQQATQAIETEQAKQQAVIEKAKIEASRDIEIARMRNDAELHKARLASVDKEQAEHLNAAIEASKIEANRQEKELDREHQREVAKDANVTGAFERERQETRQAEQGQE